MQYTVMIEAGERNYRAYVPDLPGCIATGQTLEEVKQRLREAIARVLQELAQEFALNNLRLVKAAETGSGTSLATDTPMMGVAVPLDSLTIDPASAALDQESIQPPRTSERSERSTEGEHRSMAELLKLRQAARFIGVSPACTAWRTSPAWRRRPSR